MKRRPHLKVSVVFHCAECETTLNIGSEHLAAMARPRTIQRMLRENGWYNSSSRGWLCPQCDALRRQRQ